MAPLYVACRLLPSLSLLKFVFLCLFLCLSLLILDCNMSYVYDRQTLLNIRMAIDITEGNVEECCRFPPPVYQHFLVQQRWYPVDPSWRRRRRRKRGKRGGVAVRCRSLAWSPSTMLNWPGKVCEWRVRQRPLSTGAWSPSAERLFPLSMPREWRALWRPLDTSYRRLRPVVPSILSMSPRRLPPCLRFCGVNTSNLRPLQRPTQL